MQLSSIAQQFQDELQSDIENKTLVLPTLPEVALQVREVVNSDNVTAADITKIIATDPAISARLIQVANSPLTRATDTINRLDQAVIRLGFKIVHDVVNAIAMEQMFQATSDRTDQLLRKCWEHSTTVAAISAVLARHYTKLSPEQAMLAGLTHDIGKLPIIKKAEEFPELIEDDFSLELILHKLHATIGREILKEWKFPQELIDVAYLHEELDRDSEITDFVDVVTVANLQSFIDGDLFHSNIDFKRVPAFEKLGLSTDVNVVVMEATADDIEGIKRVFD